MSEFKVEVVKIGKVEKHPNADSLSTTMIFDYPIVFRSENFKEGDLAAYVPIDSIIPETGEFEFIHGGASDIRHRRVKAKRLRGIFSMGFLHTLRPDSGFEEGQDIAETLGITKYIPPEPKSYSHGGGRQVSEVAGFPRYTDIDNFRRYSGIFTEGELVVCTEKIHGCNLRCGWLDGEFHVGSHNAFRKSAAEGWDCKDCKGRGIIIDNYREIGLTSIWDEIPCTRCEGKGRIADYHDSGQNENIWWKAVNQYNLKEKLSYFPGYLLFGEVYGDVQDLKYGVPQGEIRFAAFDVMFEGKYLDFYHFIDFVRDLDLPNVPVLYEGEYDKEIVKKLSEGFETITDHYASNLLPSHIREGCVVRPVNEKYSHFGRHILKVINPEYLLRKGGSEGR